MCLGVLFQRWRYMGMHVNHIEGNVFGAWVLGSAEGHWECDGSDGFDSFSTEAIEGLRQFPKLLSVESHFVEGFRPDCHCRQGFWLHPICRCEL
jgi:hypothetical protein